METIKFFEINPCKGRGTAVPEHKIRIYDKKNNRRLVLNRALSAYLNGKGHIYLRAAQDIITGTFYLVFTADERFLRPSHRHDIKKSLDYSSYELVKLIKRNMNIADDVETMELSISDNMSKKADYRTFIIKK